MATSKLPILREGDYWSEIVDNKAVFSGYYLGYNFRMTYRFEGHKWEDESHDMPEDILKLLRWELYLHERWLPIEDPPV
jgi:hypothetical protein